MMYPFLTMNDHTEIVYSHLLDGAGVKIYVEKPDEYDGFHHAACFLPGCRWEDIVGFSDAEIQEYQKVIESSAEQIMRLAASSKGTAPLWCCAFSLYSGNRRSKNVCVRVSDCQPTSHLAALCDL